MSALPDISILRVYDESWKTERARLLIDRVWPRGMSKSQLNLDDWIKDIAPSTSLRKWFNHDPEKWRTFCEKYRSEIDQNSEPLERCLSWCRKGPVALLYSARDPDHNQASVLRNVLYERMCGKSS